MASIWVSRYASSSYVFATGDFGISPPKMVVSSAFGGKILTPTKYSGGVPDLGETEATKIIETS